MFAVFSLLHAHIYNMRKGEKSGKLDAGNNNGNGGLSSLKHQPRNARKRLRRHGKRLGKRRLRDFQPLKFDHTEHGRLPAGCQKVSFLLLLSVSRECGVRGEQCLERGKTYVGNGKNQRWKIRKPTLEIPVS
jgi:hypothetical protein